MKRIVLCCDGTWNVPDQVSPTNVVKIALAVANRDSSGVEQRVFYTAGVGSRRRTRLRGGAFGAGLSRNVRECYRFLVENYEAGDRLYFFGFSRGAFTARSTAGMVRNSGILRREHANRLDDAFAIYRSRDRRRHPRGTEATLFRRSFSHEPRVHFIGVWDTVGALGIPVLGRRIGVARLVNRRWGFHDTTISRTVNLAYHALAIDEERGPFEPAMWHRQESAAEQTLEQVWFAGAHSDVGGGLSDPSLAEIPLLWIADKAAAAGLEFSDAYFSGRMPPAHAVHDERSVGRYVAPSSNGPMSESRRGIYKLLRPHRRSPGREMARAGAEGDEEVASGQAVASSARERMIPGGYGSDSLRAYLDAGGPVIQVRTTPGMSPWREEVFAPAEPVPQRPRVERIRAQDVEEVERAKVAVNTKLREELERNLREPVRVTDLHLAGLEFFADMAWELHPSVNVLLGRNGFGKSLLFRTLAGMLRRDAEATGDLFPRRGRNARIELGLERSGRAEKIERDREVFLQASVGEVPLLAIPDARFTDRSTTSVSETGTLHLATEGATHFLQHLPYQSTVEALLAGLAIDYQAEGGTDFDLAIFKLIERVVRKLTGQQFEFEAIERVGRTGWRIWVRTEGLGRRLEIQRASQGTLSVITIFGLVHAFLQELADAREPGSEPREQEAIVLIDEVDAHLHPAWQQKIRNLLTEEFPKVQFLLSAHSPLVVAGCGPGEVSVLRNDEGRFGIEQLGRDFVGAEPKEIYDEIFEIEEFDETFKEYLNKQARGEVAEIEERIDTLSTGKAQGKLSSAETIELDGLELELDRIGWAVGEQERRRDAEQRAVLREAEIRRRETALEELEQSLTDEAS